MAVSFKYLSHQPAATKFGIQGQTYGVAQLDGLSLDRQAYRQIPSIELESELNVETTHTLD